MMERIRLTEEEREKIRWIFSLNNEDSIDAISSYLSEYFKMQIEFGPINTNINDFTPRRHIICDGLRLRATFSVELLQDIQVYHSYDASSEIIEMFIEFISVETQDWRSKAIKECYKRIYENIKPCALLN